MSTIAEKYGNPGECDDEGFDPYADSVGPGIYGGIVERDEQGRIVIGKQYQNHNPRPGPVYNGGGYTKIVRALGNALVLTKLLEQSPHLVNDISTGGAQPLHNCGMSTRNQAQTSILIEQGADIEALDTYGYTPLHRMASNNLAIGAQLLLDAGADPLNRGGSGELPIEIAKSSRARDVLRVLQGATKRTTTSPVVEIVIQGSGESSVDGTYRARSADSMPPGFAAVCVASGWDVDQTWSALNGNSTWYESSNAAYVYYNQSDGHWWVDKEDGAGVFKARAPAHAPPATGWKALDKKYEPLPTHVGIFRRILS